MSNIINVEPIDVKEAEIASQDALNILKEAKLVNITNESEQLKALERVKKIKTFGKRLEEGRKKITVPLDVAKKAVMDLFRTPSDDLKEAEELYKKELLSYDKEQRRIAEEAQRKADEIARKEEERQRKIKEEQERKWREKEEVKRKEAERLAAEGREEESRKAKEEADKAAAKAEERAEQAEQVYVPTPVIETPKKVVGQSVSVTWKAEVTDLFALCNAIARGDLPETVVSPVMPELNALARTWKGKKAFDGVKFIKKENVSIKR